MPLACSEGIIIVKYTQVYSLAKNTFLDLFLNLSGKRKVLSFQPLPFFWSHQRVGDIVMMSVGFKETYWNTTAREDSNRLGKWGIKKPTSLETHLFVKVTSQNTKLHENRFNPKITEGTTSCIYYDHTNKTSE